MLFDNYSTQAAKASLDSLWLKTQVISNNLANVDTPGFKARNVSFEQVLRDTVKTRGSGPLTREQRAAEKEGSPTLFRTTIGQNVDTSVRVDENNVSLEQQQTELWKTYAQYSYLIDRLGGHYNSINSAISNMRT